MKRISLVLSGLALAGLAAGCSSQPGVTLNAPPATTYNLNGQNPNAGDGLSTIGGSPSPTVTASFHAQRYATFAGKGDSQFLTYTIPASDATGDYEISYTFSGNQSNESSQGINESNTDSFSITEYGVGPGESDSGFPDSSNQFGTGLVQVQGDGGTHKLLVTCNAGCSWYIFVNREP